MSNDYIIITMRKISTQKKHEAINIGEYIGEITELCKANSIDLLYLFGGAATEKTGPLSDIDLAFYSKKSDANVIEMLHCNFFDIFKRDDVDLMDLKTAGPLACFNAIKQGKLLFCADQALKIQLEYLIIAKYLNTIHLRKEYHKGLSRAIMGGNFYAKG